MSENYTYEFDEKSNTVYEWVIKGKDELPIARAISEDNAALIVEVLNRG